MEKAGDRIAALLAEISELKQAAREVAEENYEAGKAEGRRLERLPAWIEGVKAAAAFVSQYDASSSHPYRLGDCILWKFNIRKQKPRKNISAAHSKRGRRKP